MNALDPLAPSIEQALDKGWIFVPQIRGDSSDNALLLLGKEFTYLVTLPLRGDSIVVCFQGRAPQGQPRQPVHEPWRQRVPVDVAIAWALSDPQDDRALRDWRGPQGRRR